MQNTTAVIHEDVLTGVWHRDGLMRQYVQPFVHSPEPAVILQQDNAHPHVARVVRAELQQTQTDVTSRTHRIQ